MSTTRIIVGDNLQTLRTLADESVHCCVTSPPYFGLRDYDLPPTDWPEVTFHPLEGLPPVTIAPMRCCLGLEASPWEFIGHMVLVFRELHRVLRADGTLWVNMGDSYAGSWGSQGHGPSNTSAMARHAVNNHPKRAQKTGALRTAGVKEKDLYGIPWMLAFALRSDGWYLRQEIIWHKPNPMPESIKDRCTKSHEHLFLLSRSPRYHYDADAIAEPTDWDPSKSKMPDGWDTGEGGHGNFHRNGREKGKRYSFARVTKVSAGEHGQKPQHRADRADIDYVGRRNKRSVWTVTTQPFKEAHFATFPPALIEPCILAGCPEGGTVLDPFGGAGTTGLVANRLQRHAILLELNPQYAEIARKRLVEDAKIFAQVTVEAIVLHKFRKGEKPYLRLPNPPTVAVGSDWAAAILGLNGATVEALVASGDLALGRSGFVTCDSIKAYWEKHGYAHFP